MWDKGTPPPHQGRVNTDLGPAPSFLLGLLSSFPLSSVPPSRQSCQCLPPAWPPAGSLISFSGLGNM